MVRLPDWRLPLSEWFYKLIPAKATYEDTRLLAKKSGFLCRAAHTQKGALVEELRGPVLGDTLHFYFVEQRKPARSLGSFEIVGPDAHEHASWFGPAVEGTALYTVTDPGFAGQLRAFKDYAEDSTLQQFTGFLLKPTGAAATPLLPPALVLGRVTQLKKR
jgi:hypothetical protein